MFQVSVWDWARGRQLGEGKGYTGDPPQVCGDKYYILKYEI
jgi:hypothetical protein